MRLLLITQKVNKNDSILGFFHEWILRLSKKVEKITVICLEKGDYDLPKNVSVLSLGKEKSKSKIKYIFNFYKYIYKNKKEYDKVFVHMNPIYIILGFWLWGILGKKMYLWYTHKNVDLKLRFSSLFVNKIFTASKKSFRLKTKKLKVLGHGIDLNIFKPNTDKREQNKIISAGRVSKTKNYEPLIDAMKKIEARVELAGPIDEGYKKELDNIIKETGVENKISFVGPINYQNIVDFYNSANVFVNFSKTGSLDKAILEAMACGLNILTSNEALIEELPERYITSEKEEELILKIKNSLDLGIDNWAVNYVRENHNLDVLVEKLSKELND